MSLFNFDIKGEEEKFILINSFYEITMKRTCHICNSKFDNLILVREHVKVYHDRRAFVRALVLQCYFEAMEVFVAEGNKEGQPIPEMVLMFGPSSPFAWYGVNQPNISHDVPWPWTYHDALIRATWGMDDGMDNDLIETTNMVEMEDGMDQALIQEANMVEMQDGMDYELCELVNKID